MVSSCSLGEPEELVFLPWCLLVWSSKTRHIEPNMLSWPKLGGCVFNLCITLFKSILYYIYNIYIYSSVYFSSLFVWPSSFHPPAQCDLTVAQLHGYGVSFPVLQDLLQDLKTNATYTRKAQDKPCLQTVSSLTSWHVACPGGFRMIVFSQIWWVAHCGMSQKPIIKLNKFEASINSNQLEHQKIEDHIQVSCVRVCLLK